jgi:hypothetical protein
VGYFSVSCSNQGRPPPCVEQMDGSDHNDNPQHVASDSWGPGILTLTRLIPNYHCGNWRVVELGLEPWKANSIGTGPVALPLCPGAIRMLCINFLGVPESWCLQPTEVYCLIVLEARNPKSRTLLMPSSALGSLAWLVVAKFQSLLLSSLCISSQWQSQWMRV